MSQLGLRPDVKFSYQGEEIELHDLLTGLRILIGGAAHLDLESSTSNPEAGSELWEILRSAAMLDEGLSPAEIRGRQLEYRLVLHRQELESRLRRVVNFALEQVPYYRARPDQYSKAWVEGSHNLRSLPLLDKGTLRTNYEDFIVDGIDVPAELSEGDLELVTTSGTTSDRLSALSDMTLPRVPAEYEELWGLAGFERPPRCAVFTSPTCMGTQCHLGLADYDERIQHRHTLILNSSEDLFDLSRAEVGAIVDEIHRFQPDFLLVNPVYLHWLIRAAQSYSIQLPKVAFVLSSYQYLSQIQRHAIQDYFGAPVFNYYAATELGGSQLGVECHNRNFHIREDHVLVEVEAARDMPFRAEGVGPLVVTTLAARVTPLLRYQLGDIGRMRQVKCDCVVGYWTALELHGRLRDVIEIGGSWITTRQLDDVVSQTPGIDFYRCHQEEADALSFHLIPSPETPFSANELRERTAEAFDVSKVTIREVRRLDPEPSLKFGPTFSSVIGEGIQK